MMDLEAFAVAFVPVGMPDPSGTITIAPGKSFADASAAAFPGGVAGQDAFLIACIALGTVFLAWQS